MNVAIIKCSDDCIKINDVEDIDKVKIKIDYQIENIINDYITFEKISKTDMDLINIICKHLDISQVVMSYNCFYTNEYLYQTIFIEGDKDSKNINYFGTQLSNGIIAIDKVIIIKNKILDDDNCELDSITDYDIKEIIMNKIIKQGINISINGSLTSFSFITSPLERYSYNMCKDKYRIYETKIYNIILNICYEINSTDPINETASLLCKKIINGNVSLSISHEDQHCNGVFYLTLDDKYFNKLIKLLSIKDYILSYDKYENKKFSNIYRCIENEYLFNCNKENILIDQLDKTEIINKII